MRRVVFLDVLLLAVVAGLLFQIATLWWASEPEAEVAAPHEAKAPKFDLPRVDRRPPPANLAAQIADKDLFDQSRTGVQPGSATAAAPSEPVRPLTLVLLGVSGSGPEREALVKDTTQPKPQWLRQGEETGGYKVGRIDPTAIVMVGPDGQETTLVINVEKAKVGQPAVVTGPAGIQPTPAPAATRTARGVMSPGAVRTPAADIREKIERLRQEARKRRGQAVEAQ
ncbi:MAG: hypothetical protein B6D46_11955 [Polyangiaceae bacterium UTPRO1]|jgi:hypothetical protein|nr:hypothetical protein [Myxococcales bacterium]OQY65937.1 MAG: hypothetical protein B6D46_11955 [Polyangiaceae bacterium UTPRO1]